MTDATTNDATVQQLTTDESVVKLAGQLAAQLQSTQVDLAEPEDDELGDDLVFVRNGWLRVTIAGETYKLRRPFLGELRDLELSREADIETLTELSKEMHKKTDEMQRRGAEIQAEARSLNGGDPDRKRTLDQEASHMALEASRLSREVVRKAQDLRAKWWEQTFETLTPPPKRRRPKPEQLPSWVGDANLQQRVIEHWQSSPLARGGV